MLSTHKQGVSVIYWFHVVDFRLQISIGCKHNKCQSRKRSRASKFCHIFMLFVQKKCFVIFKTLPFENVYHIHFIITYYG